MRAAPAIDHAPLLRGNLRGLGAVVAMLAKLGVKLYLVSAATREGVTPLVELLHRVVRGTAEPSELVVERPKPARKAAAVKKPVAKTKTKTKTKTRAAAPKKARKATVTS